MVEKINIIWNVLSAILEENFTFANIKKIVGLSDLSELEELNENSHQDLIKATIRLRDGDLSGAMTSICSSIDSLTTNIYNRYTLGDPNIVCFQERCNKSILAIGHT